MKVESPDQLCPNDEFAYCDCGLVPKGPGKTRREVIQGRHQVEVFHRDGFPNDAEPFVTFRTIDNHHIGQSLKTIIRALELKKKTAVNLTGHHVLFLDHGYASRIQIAPSARTLRLHRTDNGWEKLGEKGIPPVQDWLVHGATYEAKYGCTLWHVSLKGELQVCLLDSLFVFSFFELIKNSRISEFVLNCLN